MLKKRGSLRWRWSFGQTKIKIREKRTQSQLQRCSGSHLKKQQRLRQLAEHWENLPRCKGYKIKNDVFNALHPCHNCLPRC